MKLTDASFGFISGSCLSRTYCELRIIADSGGFEALVEVSREFRRVDLTRSSSFYSFRSGGISWTVMIAWAAKRKMHQGAACSFSGIAEQIGSLGAGVWSVIFATARRDEPSSFDSSFLPLIDSTLSLITGTFFSPFSPSRFSF